MRIAPIALAVAFVLPATAGAAKFGVAGCGLGSIVFKDEAGPIQIVAATLNGTGFQTIGITVGTSNCEQPGNQIVGQEAFMRANYASVMRDAAAGEGQYLSALGTMLGCEEAALPRFSQVAQEGHGRIFSEATPEASLKEIKSSVARDAVLAGQCASI